MAKAIRGIGPATWHYHLPVPPSLNNAYATVTRGGRSFRVPSKSLATFKRQAAAAIAKQRRPADPLKGPLAVTLSIKRQRGDLDNRLKAALDALVSAGVIEDDREIIRIAAEWSEVEGCKATVERCHAPRLAHDFDALVYALERLEVALGADELPTLQAIADKHSGGSVKRIDGDWKINKRMGV